MEAQSLMLQLRSEQSESGSFRSQISRLLEVLFRSSERNRLSHVGLTGGNSGQIFFNAFLMEAREWEIDWRSVHFWWSDERFVAKNDEQRNDLLASQDLVNQLAVPENNIHAFLDPTEASITQAAEAYEDELKDFSCGASPTVFFDFLVLGLGSDGHIASLFPGHPALQDPRICVPVIDAPKCPSQRITFTPSTISSSERIWILAMGPEKREAVEQLLRASTASSQLPASLVSARKETLLFTDQA